MHKTRSAPHLIRVIMILGLIVALQFYAATMNTSRAAYAGIQFGTEAAVSSDAPNDVWQLEKLRYTYIADNRMKPEVDLLGLHIERNVNINTSFSESKVTTLPSINNTNNYTIDYNHSFSFNIPLTALLNVSYTLITNRTYSPSAIEVYNWTAAAFENQSVVMNQTKILLAPAFYSDQTILIHFNITNTQEFGFWYNLTFEFWYMTDQILSIQFASLTAGNASLVDHLRAWVFLDLDANDQLDYAIQWVYGNGTFLYQINNQSFTLDGWWDGTFSKYWTGITWVVSGLPKGDLGVLDYGEKLVNMTIPAFLVNLTATVRYAVWAQKIESNYDWWDALPDDPNWYITTPIPGFQWLLLALSLIIAAVIFLGKRKALVLKTK
ncbi:MAG: hypothetical protein LUQ65_11305 [Candidatus Helarchaeota archaeon]|nr:hypothetical protein [Candidatus Helarchaeota archaeon]